MLYDVYDQNNHVVGQVEGNTSSEAWHYARRMYETGDRIVLDVRQTGGYSEEQKRTLAKLAGIYPSELTINDDLRTSMVEENEAVSSYHKRAEYAREMGDEISAGLWEHIAEEEIGHYNEFKDRLGSL